MFVLIVGAGRVGSALAKATLAAGHEVSVLDTDPLSHERLEENRWTELGGRRRQIHGRHRAGRSTRCLTPASKRADVFIASTDGDNTNLTVAQIAQRRFGVSRRLVCPRGWTLRGRLGTPEGSAYDLADPRGRMRANESPGPTELT